MSPVRNQLNTILDGMAESDLYLLLAFLGRFCQTDPDDVLTEEDLADIQEAREEYRKGETVAWEDIDLD